MEMISVDKNELSIQSKEIYSHIRETVITAQTKEQQ